MPTSKALWGIAFSTQVEDGPCEGNSLTRLVRADGAGVVFVITVSAGALPATVEQSTCAGGDGGLCNGECLTERSNRAAENERGQKSGADALGTKVRCS